jgi:hypothetical protein
LPELSLAAAYLPVEHETGFKIASFWDAGVIPVEKIGPPPGATLGEVIK